MPKIGDFLRITEYLGGDAKIITSHYFIIVSDVPSVVSDSIYDFIAIQTTSVKNLEHKNFNLGYDYKVLLDEDDVKSKKFKNKESIADCRNLYFFKQEYSRYSKAGRVAALKMSQILNKVKYMTISGKTRQITCNLNPNLTSEKLENKKI